MLTGGQGSDRHEAEFPDSVRAKALENALEIRKFEIELYWSRASYFWAIIALALGGFFALEERADTSDGFVVACIGLAFSWAWYLVNRGSAFWQRNWAGHVDLLENSQTGPLHKSIITRESHKLHYPLAPYKFSPSRLNVMLSIFVCSIWLFLAVRTAYRVVIGGGGLTGISLIGGLTLGVVVCTPIFSGVWNGNKDRKLLIRKRTVDVDYL